MVQRQAEEEEEVQTNPLIQRQAEEGEEVQTKPYDPGAGFEAGRAVEGQLRGMQGGGQPLPAEVRAYMEPRFGADFSGVRVHTDGQAAQLNRQLSAQAFTHGHDIYMPADRYQPESEGGRRLLAHELTHVIQQGGRHDRIARWGGMGNVTHHKEVTKAGIAEHLDPNITFMGLAGLGDLVLTCTDDQSRNRRCGLLLAAGKTLEQAQAEIGQVVEGVLAAKAVHTVAARLGVDMPICEHVYRVLYEGMPIPEVVESMLRREVSAEN